MRKVFLLAAAVVAMTAQVGSAQVLMDQIGANPADVTGAFASQQFEAANAAFTIGAIDNFSVPGGPGSLLTIAEAAVNLFGGGTAASYAAIQNYRLEIYSTRAASGVNLTGNVASAVLPTSAATLTPYGAGALQRLLSLNLAGANITLAPGSYFLAIIPTLDFTPNGQIGVSASAFAGATPGGLDAYQANPGGGFAFTGPPPGTQTIAPPTNLAYRLTGTPVPEPTSMALMGVAVVGYGLRRWKKRKG